MKECSCCPTTSLHKRKNPGTKGPQGWWGIRTLEILGFPNWHCWVSDDTVARMGLNLLHWLLNLILNRGSIWNLCHKQVTNSVTVINDRRLSIIGRCWHYRTVGKIFVLGWKWSRFQILTLPLISHGTWNKVSDLSQLIYSLQEWR